MTAPGVSRHVRTILGILVQGVHHAVVVMAVVAMLLVTLRMHAHTSAEHGPGPCPDHSASLSFGTILGDDETPDQPDAADADGCGHCHCPSASVTVPESATLAVPLAISVLGPHGHSAAVPDSPTYPPDPPPVRRG